MKHFGLILSCFLAIHASALADSLKNTRPNVILFFMDDMGYADIGAFGSQNSKTPYIDRLAQEGVKFTSFYNAWTACSPSRASLLTGCYAGRVEMDKGVCFPHKDKALNPKEYTMAEMFKSAGYVTGIFGKWHLGHLPGFLPPAHGFDEYWGIPYSNDMWKKKYPPLPFIHNNEVVAIVDSEEDHQLLQRAYHDKLLAFVKANKKKPFFAFVPHSAVHNPQLPKQEYLDRAKNKTNSALLAEVDDQMGELLQLLKETGIDDNTVVMFMSDNGGIQRTERQPLRGYKMGTEYEAHMRTLLVARWPAKLAAGKVCDTPAVSMDFLPTFAQWVGGQLSENKIDGKDISYLFTQPETTTWPHEFITYRAAGIRVGDWKVIYNRKTKKVELYNLKEDISETKDLAVDHPEKVTELRALQAKWYDALKAEMRPHARMENCRPLVTADEAKKFPVLTKWLETQTK
jgi:arylsulfatase A